MISQTPVAKADPAFADLYAYLAVNASHWCDDITTYAPVDYYTSPDLTINVTGSMIVVNFRVSGGTWKQISHRRPKGQ